MFINANRQPLLNIDIYCLTIDAQSKTRSGYFRKNYEFVKHMNYHFLKFMYRIPSVTLTTAVLGDKCLFHIGYQRCHLF